MISPKQLYAGELGAASAAVYTVPAGKTAIIQAALLVNGGSGAPIVSVLFNTIDVLRNKALTVDQSYVADELRRHVLEAGSQIFASADTGGVVRMIISGVEVDV